MGVCGDVRDGITWDRFERFHGDVLEAVGEAVRAACGAAPSAVASPTSIPTAGAVLHGPRPGRRGSELEQWAAIKAAAATRCSPVAAPSPTTTPSGRPPAWYDRQRRTVRDGVPGGQGRGGPGRGAEPGVLIDPAPRPRLSPRVEYASTAGAAGATSASIAAGARAIVVGADRRPDMASARPYPLPARPRPARSAAHRSGAPARRLGGTTRRLVGRAAAARSSPSPASRYALESDQSRQLRSGPGGPPRATRSPSPTPHRRRYDQKRGRLTPRRSPPAASAASRAVSSR